MHFTWMRAVVRPARDRLCGPDVISALAEQAWDTGYTFHLFGGAPEVLESMPRNMEARFPHLQNIGMHSPPFRSLTDEENQAIQEDINRLRPDFVLVGLGTRTEDYWVDDQRDKLRGTILLAVGAAFDFPGVAASRRPHSSFNVPGSSGCPSSPDQNSRACGVATPCNAKFLRHSAVPLARRGHRQPMCE